MTAPLSRCANRPAVGGDVQDAKTVIISEFLSGRSPTGRVRRQGYLEIDLVAHCGAIRAESFIYGLAATDVATGWMEVVPLLARGQTLIAQGLEANARRLPVIDIGYRLR